jgi:hypothetical protein
MLIQFWTFERLKKAFSATSGGIPTKHHHDHQNLSWTASQRSLTQPINFVGHQALFCGLFKNFVDMLANHRGGEKGRKTKKVALQAYGFSYYSMGDVDRA